MSPPLFCSLRTVAQSTACMTLPLWWFTMVPGKCVSGFSCLEKAWWRPAVLHHAWEFSLNSLKNGFRYIKVGEVEFSFNFGVKEYSWKDVVKEEGTWKQNGEEFIWSLHAEPKLFVHKILSSLYSRVFYFLCHVTFKLGKNGKLFGTYFMSSILKIHFLFYWNFP